ncbi:carbohydrate ABC transporter substrate-binding protein, CUT1 family [Natronoarchaeum philippinense]|uniref:Carbohydrate ABC transporter substrate-binding protein, CUT1 family n=1 Tax=Natronoarchaeum philippinense TaxID=558529 RepID=A0A285P8U6_NATPI|nr:extracellular solute-binding protein [Natronoarchaeum philippinense]SNZ17677.1 carbohydrate ABC transporter substrate-binding protein, CUT1 family [Natronoarchaeum philippinense]
MDTNRRALLRRLGATSGLSLLAGCSGSLPGGGSGDDGDDGEPEPESDNQSAGDDNTSDGDADQPSGGRAMLWHSMRQSEIETFQESRDQFNDAHGSTIVAKETGDLRNRVERAVDSGDGPEMYRWAQDWVGGHWQRDFLYDASDDLSITPSDKFSEAAVQAITVDGGDATIGLPVGGETVTLLYNKDMIDSPPETFAEMESIMQEYYNPNNGKYGLSHPIDAYFASAWMHAFGGYYFQVNDRGEGVTGLDLDETKLGMQFLRDRIWPYIPQDINPGPQQQVFQSGNAPFAVNGPWMIDTFEQNGVNVGVTSFPTVDGNAPSPYTGTTMWYFSTRMGDDAKRRKAALDYAEWIATNEDHQLARAEAHDAAPVLDSIDADALGERAAGFKRSYDAGIAMPAHPKMSSVWMPTEDAMTAVLLDGASIDARFDQAAAEIRSSWDQ